MSLPLGGSLSLPPTTTTPQGTLPHVNSSKIYSSFLVPSAGDKDEKSDSYVTSRSDKKKMDKVAKEIDEEENGSDEEAENSKRKALVKEIETNIHSNASKHTDHKINLDRLLSVKSPHSGTLDSADDLHESLRSERNSFINAAMHRNGYTPLGQVIPPGTQGEEKKEKTSEEKGHQSPEESKAPENPDEKLPSLEEIEKNPNSSREKKLTKHVGGVTRPPYASNS
jgi:hypothetical protein